MNISGIQNNKSIYAILAICAIICFFYWPGLHSGFYLDDTMNLKNLARISNSDSILAFLLDNKTVRILSYLSFIPHHEAWVSQDPFPFKLTNLIIHIINSILVFILTLKITEKLEIDSRRSLIIASLTTLCWAISPMHINSVLYVIQRMTLLSSMFILLACIYFMTIKHNRQDFSHWMFSAFIVGLFYGFGILCKENAILIGVHIAVLMITITGRKNIPSWWIALVIVLPFFLTIGYLFYADRIIYRGRDFTLDQRLLTEAKIILVYFRKIIFSLPQDISLYNDDYPFIKSISSEKTVLLYIAAIFGTAIFALIYRKKFPAASLSILWFLSGHLLESTIVPLELYFEHRNYLPALGIYFGMVYWVVTCKRYKIIIWPIFLAIVINAFVTTHLEIASWKSRDKFVIDAILDRPHSTRAMQVAAEYYLSHGDILKAAKLIQYAHHNIKPYSSHLLYLMALKCLDNRTPLEPFNDVLNEIRLMPYDRYLEKATHEIFSVLQSQECAYFSWQNYDELLQALNKKAPRDYANYYLMHRVFAYRVIGNEAAALATVEQMNISTGSIDQGFFKVYMLLEYEKKAEAREALNALLLRFEKTPYGFINRMEIEGLKRLTSIQ